MPINNIDKNQDHTRQNVELVENGHRCDFPNIKTNCLNFIVCKSLLFFLFHHFYSWSFEICAIQSFSSSLYSNESFSRCHRNDVNICFHLFFSVCYCVWYCILIMKMSNACSSQIGSHQISPMPLNKFHLIHCEWSSKTGAFRVRSDHRGRINSERKKIKWKIKWTSCATSIRIFE